MLLAGMVKQSAFLLISVLRIYRGGILGLGLGLARVLAVALSEMRGILGRSRLYVYGRLFIALRLMRLPPHLDPRGSAPSKRVSHGFLAANSRV